MNQRAQKGQGALEYLLLIGGAVVVAAVAAMVIGFLWYGPIFGKVWIKLMGFTQKDIEKGKSQGMAKNYVILAITTLVMAYVLSYFIDALGMLTIGAGMATGFLAWFGFIMPVMTGSVLWEGKSWSLFWLNNAHYLVSLVVMGAILAAWAY